MPWYEWILNEVISIYHLGPLLRNFPSVVIHPLLFAVSHLLSYFVSHGFAYRIPATAIRGLIEFALFSIGMGRSKPTVMQSNTSPAHLNYMESACTKCIILAISKPIEVVFFMNQTRDCFMTEKPGRRKNSDFISATKEKETGFIPQPSPAEVLSSQGYCSI